MEWQLTHEQWSKVRGKIERLVFHREEEGKMIVRCERNLKYFYDVRTIIAHADSKSIFDFSLL